jgi:hypothetical protein
MRSERMPVTSARTYDRWARLILAVTGVVLLLIGVSMTSDLLRSLVTRYRIATRGVEVEGTVIRREHVAGRVFWRKPPLVGGGGPVSVPMPVIQYEYGGRTYEFRPFVSSVDGDFHVSQKVPVIFPVERPQEAYLKNQSHVTSVIPAAIGLVLTGAGAVFLIAWRRW